MLVPGYYNRTSHKDYGQTDDSTPPTRVLFVKFYSVNYATLHPYKGHVKGTEKTLITEILLPTTI